MPSTVTDRLFGLTTSVAVKAPCDAVATSNITLAGLQTVNSVVLSEGMRVLCHAQSNAVDNGIYLASSSAWQRAPDFDGARDAVQGTQIPITSNGAQTALYEVATANPFTIGTSQLGFVARYSANSQYDTTSAEITAAVTIVNRAYPAMHVLRYGTNSIPGTTVMDTALAAALSVAAANGGGIVILPAGKFKITTGLAVAAGVIIQGSGSGTSGGSNATGTTIVHAISASGSVGVTLGTSDTALSYGCGLRDVNILMTQANTIGLVLRATQEANISNALIFGDQLNATYTGIEIRGGTTVSNFGNLFQNAYCLYMHRGLRFLTVGATPSTSSTFVNFQAVYNTVDDPTSIGVEFTSGNGNTSIFYGGNFEGLGTAFKFANDTQGVSGFGVRFEVNTADINWGTPSGTGRNTFFGYGYAAGPSELGTRGDNNLILGQFFGDVRISRGKANLTNLAVGDDNTLQAVTTGTANSGFGANALKALTTGVQNTGVGAGALAVVVAGNNNTALGKDALSGVTSGGSNVGLGISAAGSVTTGSSNTGCGPSTAPGIDGSNNTAIGNGAGAASSPHTIAAGESNRLVVGNNSVTNAYIVAAWTVTSDERDKWARQPLREVGLAVVDGLIPIRYRFDARTRYESGVSDGSKANEFESAGFSAQNVMKALSDAGMPTELCVDSTDPEHLGLTETRLMPFLVLAIQELTARVNSISQRQSSTPAAPASP